jgi:diguanylate cyclase (GGDEF)-like protein/PAS domain S-box-containing protein
MKANLIDVANQQQKSNDKSLPFEPIWIRRIAISMVIVGLMIAWHFALLVLYSPQQWTRFPAVLVALTVCLITCLPLLRGDGRKAIKIMSYGAFLYVAVSVLTGEGFKSPLMIALPLVITIPGLLLGRKIAKQMALLSSALCLVLLFGHWMDLWSNKALIPVVFYADTILVVIGISWLLTNFACSSHALRLKNNAQLARKLADSNHEFRTLAENLPALVMRTDLGLTCTYVNKPFLRFARLSEAELVGKRLDSIFTAEQVSLIPEALRLALKDRRVCFKAPHRRDQEQHIFELMVVAETDTEETPTGFLTVLYDVTERERMTAELHKSATHDFLTGLANRMLVEDRLESALARASRFKQQFALLVIDLDGFKLINDVHGHAAGDQMLKHIASQLKKTLRGVDTIGRMGGDEFVVLVEDHREIDSILNISEKLLQAMQSPLYLGSEMLSVSASIGIALYPVNGETTRDLFHSADAAMYEAKGAGKNGSRLAKLQ